MTDKSELKELIIGAVARGWCHPDTARKEMDATLAMAIADEVHAAILRKLADKPERKAQDDGGYDLVAAWDRSGFVYPDGTVDPVFQAGWDAARSTT